VAEPGDDLRQELEPRSLRSFAIKTGRWPVSSPLTESVASEG
jgi:hypothetical protein